jgi:hypothetical protein
MCVVQWGCRRRLSKKLRTAPSEVNRNFFCTLSIKQPCKESEVFQFSSQKPYRRTVKSVFEVPVFKTDGRHDRFWFAVFVRVGRLAMK